MTERIVLLTVLTKMLRKSSDAVRPDSLGARSASSYVGQLSGALAPGEGWRRAWEFLNAFSRKPMESMVSRSSLATATI